MTAVEEQFMMEHYDILHDMFGDYLEMVVQFGYATLFSAAFLFAPLLACINNYVEIRVDAWKITSLCQRPLPKPAEDIGSWQTVMQIMGTAAVITNVALICFTSSLLDNLNGTERFVVFACMEHFLIGFKVFLEVAIEDVPQDVTFQTDRQAAYVNRIILGKEDDYLDIMDYEKKHGEPLSHLQSHKSTPVDMQIRLADLEYREHNSKLRARRSSVEALSFHMNYDSLDDDGSGIDGGAIAMTSRWSMKDLSKREPDEEEPDE